MIHPIALVSVPCSLPIDLQASQAWGRSLLERKLQRRQAGQAFRIRSLAEVEFFVDDLNALEQQDENDQFGHSGTVGNKRSGEQCPPL